MQGHKLVAGAVVCSLTAGAIWLGISKAAPSAATGEAPPESRTSDGRSVAMAPFGVNLEAVTCAEQAKLWHVEPEVGASVTTVKAPAPRQLFPGAHKIYIGCFNEGDKRVQFLSATIDKGGIGAENAVRAYEILSSKYQLQDGGPIPPIGDGDAMFLSSTGWVIGLSSPHLSFTYDVSYESKNFHKMRLRYEQDQAAKSEKREKDAF